MSPFCLPSIISKPLSRLQQKLKPDLDTALESEYLTSIESKTPSFEISELPTILETPELPPNFEMSELPSDSSESRDLAGMSPLNKPETLEDALKEYLSFTTGTWSPNNAFTFISDSRRGSDAIKLHKIQEIINGGEIAKFTKVLVSKSFRLITRCSQVGQEDQMQDFDHHSYKAYCLKLNLVKLQIDGRPVYLPFDSDYRAIFCAFVGVLLRCSFWLHIISSGHGSIT